MASKVGDKYVLLRLPRNPNTYAVKMCPCCIVDGFHDAWCFDPKQAQGDGIGHRGLHRATVRRGIPLTLEQVAERAPALVAMMRRKY